MTARGRANQHCLVVPVIIACSLSSFRKYCACGCLLAMASNRRLKAVPTDINMQDVGSRYGHTRVSRATLGATCAKFRVGRVHSTLGRGVRVH